MSGGGRPSTAVRDGRLAARVFVCCVACAPQCTYKKSESPPPSVPDLHDCLVGLRQKPSCAFSNSGEPEVGGQHCPSTRI